MLKIGTLADWFGVGVLEGIKSSQKCGATGVQLYAWNELNPFTVSDHMINEVRKTAEGCGQKITALCGELSEISPGGSGLEIAEDNPKQIEFLKRTFDLANKLDCNVVTTHIGVVPEDKENPTWHALHEACDKLGEYAKAQDAWLAIETGPEVIPRLCSFVDSCSSGRVAINYDPANLVMVTNDDEVAGVYTAGKRIVHTHAKDGIMKEFYGPEEVYAIFAKGGVESLASLSNYFEETPLGKGSVRWAEYIKALLDVGYDGYLTIEREVSANATKDIQLAVDFLKEILKTIER